MSRRTIGLILGLLLCPILSLAAQAQSAITEQEAQSIAVDAYIYFYPLVTMDVTRKQLTNVEPGKGIGAPMNTLFNVPTLSYCRHETGRAAEFRYACIPSGIST